MRSYKYIFNYLNLHNNSAGTGTFSKNILLGIKKHRPEIIDDLVILLNSNSTKWIDLATRHGFNVYKFNLTNIRPIVNVLSYIIPSFYLKKRSTYFSFIGIFPLFKAKNSKIITTIHDTIALQNTQKYQGLRKKLIYFSFRFAILKSDTIITVSENSRQDLLRNFNLNNKKIKIIPNFTRTNNENKLEINGFKSMNKKYFLFVGNIQPGKNILSLIKAFHRFIQTKKGYHLIIVGNKSTKHFKEVIALVKKLNLEKIVSFEGFVEDTSIYYKNSHCFVFPSLYEGFGIPILEAMKNGCTIACSNTSSLPWVAGKTAIYFNPNDVQSICDALNLSLNSSEVEKRKSNYRKQLKKFSEEKIITDFVQALF